MFHRGFLWGLFLFDFFGGGSGVVLFVGDFFGRGGGFFLFFNSLLCRELFACHDEMRWTNTSMISFFSVLGVFLFWYQCIKFKYPHSRRKEIRAFYDH